jgi:hypothetical protein
MSVQVAASVQSVERVILVVSTAILFRTIAQPSALDVTGSASAQGTWTQVAPVYGNG